MRLRPLITFVLGTAFFAALPVLAPPGVLLAGDVLRFLLGMGAAALAGAALVHVAGTTGTARGMGMVAACVVVGAVLYTALYAAPTFGSGEPPGAWPALAVVTSVYAGVPAVIGAALVAGTARRAG